MTPLGENDTRLAIIDGVLERSLLTAGDGQLLETIGRLELFLRRYPGDIFLSGALLFYLRQLLQAPDHKLEHKDRQRLEDRRPVLEALPFPAHSLQTLIEIPASAGSALEAVATRADIKINAVTLQPFDGRPNLLHAIAPITPVTLLPIAEFVAQRLAAHDHIRLLVKGTALPNLRPHTLVMQLRQLLLSR